jgi:hypothetical protein
MAITATILGEDVQLSGNPVEIECTGASAPEGSRNYQVLLRSYSMDGKLENFPKTDAIHPKSGTALFDISGYVDQPVDLQFQFPPTAAVVSYATQAYNIQVQPGECWIDEDGVLKEEWGSVSETFQILKGGLSQLQLNMMRDASTNFYQFYLQGTKFLTPRPWGDYVHPTQPVMLWFMPIYSTAAQLKVKTYFDDGTDDTYTAAFTTDTDKLYQFNVNPANLGVTLETTTKRAKHFDVWVSSATVSESRRFTFDWKYCERPSFLFFANSLGGIDDVYLSGGIKEIFNTEGETAYKPATRTDTAMDPTLIVTNKTGQNRWTINTGWKTLATLQYLRDLMVTRQAWYAYGNAANTSFVLRPVIIEPGEKTLYDRQKDLWSMDIEISEAHKSRFTFDNRSY